MFFVYVYAHPQNKVPFYVGKGTGDRDQYHWWNKQAHYNETLRDILLELHQAGQRPMITRVLETLDENLAYAEEKRLIQLYGRLDIETGTLCNKTFGGEGFGNTGTVWSDKQREKRKQTYERGQVGVGFTQYNLRGAEIRTFHCTRELQTAGFSATQIMAIRRCCKGDRHSVGGFRWSYAGHPLPQTNTLMKRVQQFAKSGEFIAEFISVAEASRLLGINQGDIAGVARGDSKSKTAGGYIWKYILPG